MSLESEALKLFPASVPFILSYAIGCGAAFSAVQSVKMARRECRVAKLPNFVIRVFAGACAAAFTFASLYIFFHVEFEQAAFHALIAAVMWPLVMTIIMSWVKVKWPTLYQRLKVPRRRLTDYKGDPNDTIDGFW